MKNNSKSAISTQPATASPQRRGTKGTYSRRTISEKGTAMNVSRAAYAHRRKIASAPTETLKFIPLGGLGEIGKNMYAIEYGNDIVVIDAGLMFPDEEMLGIDFVIPDISYLEENRKKIRGILITHGHEDHIGGLAYLLKKVNIPIYATKLTIGLIKGKLEEHRLLNSAKLVEIKPRDNITLGSFNIEMIHVNHSIPDAVGLAIRCPAGVIIQTGDFKIDTTPVDGDMIDLSRFAEYGRKGVLALLSDSTNAERPGYTPSEKSVGDSFENLFRKANKKRIVVATFASNIHRVQQIIDVAYARKRKVAVVGRSLENLVKVGSELGYLNVPQGLLIDINTIKNYADDQLVIITTGSQGEPMSALTKIAFGAHTKVTLSPNDYVIISATPIPGNEKMVGNVVNELMRHGVEVIYEKMYDVHVSGHACQEEIKLMHTLVKPKYLIPVHGEYRMLWQHGELAESMGMPRQNIILPEIGQVIELGASGVSIAGEVPTGTVLVDGLGIGDVGNVVLRDRKHLSQDGLIIVAMAFDRTNCMLVSGPDVISRGFVYMKDNEDLMDAMKMIATHSLEVCHNRNISDWATIKSTIKGDLSQFLFKNTKRNPMILPVIMEI